MARKKAYRRLTDEETINQINPENIRLIEDFIDYKRSQMRSPETLKGYRNDLEIFFVWNLLNNGNKPFVNLAKRDIIAYQNFCLNDNKNSPARLKRLKSTLSELGNYIETVLDDEYEDYRCNIKKIKSPPSQLTFEQTVLSNEQVEFLINTLVEQKKYQQACCIALAAYSGSRKTELTEFRLEFFDNPKILFGSLIKSPKIKTKGLALGKYIPRWVLYWKFKPYLDLWLQEREEKGIQSEWLFVAPNSDGTYRRLTSAAIGAWADSCTQILGVDFYMHALRHFFVTELSRAGVPDSVIQMIVGWSSRDMVDRYCDLEADDEIGKYFDENGLKQDIKQGTLSDLK
jgi:integrase